MEPHSANPSHTGPIRLLVVDDDDATVFGYGEYFRAHGWFVDVAGEKEEAEALLAHRRYDAVVSDLRLTGMSSVEGLEVLGFAASVRPRPRCVLVSAYATEATEQQACRDGIDRVIRKPIPSADLERVLLDLLSGVCKSDG